VFTFEPTAPLLLALAVKLSYQSGADPIGG